jgi:hypothetical protein
MTGNGPDPVPGSRGASHSLVRSCAIVTGPKALFADARSIPGEGRNPVDAAVGLGVSRCGWLPGPDFLLGHLCWWVTWENVDEHAADRLGHWGSRGREFESRRPDGEAAGQGWFRNNGTSLLIVLTLI